MKWVKLGQSEGAASPKPPARSSHSNSTVTVQGEQILVIFGGESQPRTPVPTDVWLYNTSTQNWSRPAEIRGTPPCPRFGHTSATVGTSILIFGGRTEVAEQSSMADLYKFDVASSTWEELVPAAGSPVPPSRNYHAAASDGLHRLWIFGGCGKEGRLNDLWQYDIRTRVWSQLPTNPEITGRGGPGFAYALNALWVVGGFSGKEMGDCFKFDLGTQQWSTVIAPTAAEENQQPFTARSVFAIASHPCSSCAHGNHITVFGGEIDPSDLGHAGAGQFAGDILCLDGAVGSWHKITPTTTTKGGKEEMPAPRGWTAASAVKQGIIVFGGVDLENERLDDLWLLDLH